MLAEMLAAGSGGGQTVSDLYLKSAQFSGQTIPSFGGITQVPNKVLLIIGDGSWAGNVNPSTQQVDNTGIWSTKDAGVTWKKESSVYSWVITNNSVALNRIWTTTDYLYTLLLSDSYWDDVLIPLMQS